MRPKVVVLHHTAAPEGRNAPSLNVVIHGRSDLPGPLCHVLIGRDGTCYVIAAGVAHHAGTGEWQGVTGNSQAIGIEVENTGTGTEPWTPMLFDVMVRACRALAKGADIPAAMVCGHKEWAPRRKVDPYGIDMGEFRRLVANPPAPEPEEDDMAIFVEMILSSYREAGRNPEAKGNAPGVVYWLNELRKAASDAKRLEIVNYCRHLLKLGPVA